MSSTRETRLMQIVACLWHQLGQHEDLTDLERQIHASGDGWALQPAPWHDPDTRLTVEQIALETGYSQSTIRDWPRRYGIRPDKRGLYRWGDIQTITRKPRKNAG